MEAPKRPLYNPNIMIGKAQLRPRPVRTIESRLGAIERRLTAIERKLKHD